MREITLEVPITEQPELTEGLKHVEVVEVLKFRSDGFVLLCRGSQEGSRLAKEKLAKVPRTRVSVLNRDKAGNEVFQVFGHWIDSIKDSVVRRRTMSLFKSMERAQIYALGLRFEDGVLRVPLIAKKDLIEQLLVGLQGVNAPFKILNLGRPRTRVNSALDSLTMRQRNILKLAHALGYYDVPRRTRTEALARLLQMDRGTLGEHLRRAEKHVFDSLLNP